MLFQKCTFTDRSHKDAQVVRGHLQAGAGLPAKRRRSAGHLEGFAGLVGRRRAVPVRTAAQLAQHTDHAELAPLPGRRHGGQTALARHPAPARYLRPERAAQNRGAAALARAQIGVITVLIVPLKHDYLGKIIMQAV